MIIDLLMDYIFSILSMITNLLPTVPVDSKQWDSIFQAMVFINRVVDLPILFATMFLVLNSALAVATFNFIKSVFKMVKITG